MATREFAREFERNTPDVSMAKKGAKVYMVLVLNQDTLRCLDAYVTMPGRDNIAHLETIHNRLYYIPCTQMLAYLK